MASFDFKSGSDMNHSEKASDLYYHFYHMLYDENSSDEEEEVVHTISKQMAGAIASEMMRMCIEDLQKFNYWYNVKKEIEELK